MKCKATLFRISANLIIFLQINLMALKGLFEKAELFCFLKSQFAIKFIQFQLRKKGQKITIKFGLYGLSFKNLFYSFFPTKQLKDSFNNQMI